MTKDEILRRTRVILNDMRRLIGHSKFLGEEVSELEVLLDFIEEQYAALIDDYMAAEIERYNRNKKRRRYG